MKRNTRRALSALLSVLMLLSLLVIPAGAEETKPTVWLVGDSTVSAFNDAYYYPRYGYGTQIGTYLDGTYDVQNLAVSGTSSLSFTSNANYDTLFGTSGIQAGDTLIIGFGHNDEKTDERYTSPTEDYKTEGSFAHSLYENYIKKAQAAGAEVIVCTPIVRRTTSSSWSDNSLHIANGGSYPEAIKTMLTDLTKDGLATGVTVVDMTTITKGIYDTLTPSETLYLHAWTSMKAESVDNTHLNIYGAKVVARALLEAVQTANDTNLAAHVALGTAPTKDTDLVSNPDYVEPDYAPPTTSSELWNDYVAGDVHFKGTAMGQLGGTPTTSNYVFETDANGNMHIAVKNNKGKITSTNDGIAMYYYQIPVGKTFTLSATAKVNDVGTSNPNQAAFGLMARDDMYIDTRDDALASDYVVAGTFGDSSANCFRRKSGKLEKPAAMTGTLTVGESYALTLSYNGDGFTCTFGDETPQSEGYDYQLTAVDSEYVYVGMFCARSFDVTYRDIVLTVDGVELCNTTMEEVPFAFTVQGWAFADADGGASDTAVEGGKLASVTGALDGSPREALVFAAVYDLEGKMTGLKAITPKTGEIPVGLAMNGGETAKVFVLNKTTLAPYGEVFSKTSGQPPKDTDAPEGRIKVWDLAAVQMTDETLYENCIVPASWNDITTKGSITNGAHDFDGLTVQCNSSERIYSNVDGVTSYGTATNYVVDFKDGYTSGGGVYMNGTGNASRRYLIVQDVKAGDKIVSYMGSHSSGAVTFSAGTVTSGTTATEDYTGPEMAAGNYAKFEYIAKSDGDFKIWVSTGSGKPFYMRVMLLKPAEVTGTVTLPTGFDATGWGLKFINQTTKDETAATLTGNSFTAKLAPGYTYTATLTGATGWGFTNATKQVTVTDAESVTGKTGLALAVEAKSTYTYSGKVTGFASGYDVSKLAVTLEPDAESAADGVLTETLTLGADLSYSVTLEPTVVYTVTLSGVNDYEVTDGGTVSSEGTAVAQDITVALKATYPASGGFVTLSDGNVYGPLYDGYEYAALNATVTALTFTNVDDNYIYTATVADGGYTADLRDGAYLATATVDGYSTSTHVVVDGGAVSRDLFFVSTAAPAAVEYAADLYVGYSDKANNYATITQAVDAIGRMSRANGERVTVHIAPGTYREQIQLNTPNVTFVNAAPSQGEVVLTWYYGIGYKYYSASSDNSTTSIYNVERAYDKYAKNIAGRWGATMWLTADGFRAEGITFESSFNNYITDEELADGVACDSFTFVRKYGAEVTSKAATERAAVLYADGSKAATTEFKNCSFLSSQDTIITGGDMYFKNCLIEGMTDYICGPGNAIFDGCELRFKGYHKDYANATTGGHITAPQTGSSEKGYLFRSCSVTVSPNANMTVGTGDFGRNWSATAGAMFVNTKLQSAGLISSAGWTDWSATQLAKDANFKEYNTTLFTGEAVSTTGRVEGTVLTAAPAFALADYFGDWTPVYYVAENATVAFTSAPQLSDNGDINAPYPGHTLTVTYSLGDNDANDVSMIQWYRVKTGEADVLVKSSVANVDQTYLIDAEDVGCWIKATVTPRTVGGVTGTAASVTLASEAYVREGFEDPTNSTDPELGDGVNVFLAGDSTVKDYSAAGMYNSGTIRVEGSWGEFLQNYFNKDLVTVVNYANGGRSSRTFYNEGSLLKIAKDIKKGDYLFIQFGHNDCGGSVKYADRCVPLGDPDADGIYPTTAPTTGTAPTMSADGTITAGTYAWDCGGTYKWFLQQYIDVALDAGAIPVLITPVARMYYGSDGKIVSHHNWGEVRGEGNTYCDAVKQLYEENLAAGKNVLFLDGYTLTETIFNNAYAAAGSDAYGKQLMGSGESTHNNKLGGMIEAALIAQALQTVTDKNGANISIAHAVKAPAAVLGETPTGETVFTVNNSGILTAYDILTDYASRATYWEGVGQTMFQTIANQAAAFNTSSDAQTE